jgi:hypothetical protein
MFPGEKKKFKLFWLFDHGEEDVGKKHNKQKSAGFDTCTLILISSGNL